ncbi:unnamed protein product [Heligmosomoides polygyrus]|uniref:Terpene_synth_C domain-containing protein n=1 Tax=Heligmosomoides polygyrus TaxID=6339 RepID=A0A183GR44_HELPZ|nr:unnamed protein product [Heligmosomoides polygyrus]
MSEPKVVSTEEYLRSLSIPQFPLNFEAEDQLKIHLMCAMLCCPKQIADDGTLSVHEINKNIWQVSEHFLDLYVIARDATKDDEIEFSKIAGNLSTVLEENGTRGAFVRCLPLLQKAERRARPA